MRTGLDATNTPISLPAEGRDRFFIDRFLTLTEAEQCMILARALSMQGHEAAEGQKTAAIENAVEIFQERDQAWRVAAFQRTVGSGCPPDSVTRLLMHPHQSYFPCLLVALNAAYEGDDIGLLTARENRRGHSELIEAIEGFIGLKIPRKNIYFVNDATRNKRLGQLSTAEKKLRIQRDFLDGTYRDEHGQIRPLSRIYQRVLFYDDEAKNLETVAGFARANALDERLAAVHAGSISVADVWAQLERNVMSGRQPEIGLNPVIHFFDIDGTLVRVDAKMYVVHRETGERLLTISQGDLAEHPSVPYWIAEAERLMPGLASGSLEMDFGDFADPSRVSELIQKGRPGNHMFKK